MDGETKTLQRPTAYNQCLALTPDSYMTVCGLELYSALCFRLSATMLVAITSNHLCIHHVQQISGQEDLSHKAHCHRLFAPLWPSSLGITDNCQYTTIKEIFKSQSQKPGQCFKSLQVLYLLLFLCFISSLTSLPILYLLFLCREMSVQP